MTFSSQTHTHTHKSEFFNFSFFHIFIICSQEAKAGDDTAHSRPKLDDAVDAAAAGNPSSVFCVHSVSNQRIQCRTYVVYNTLTRRTLACCFASKLFIFYCVDSVERGRRRGDTQGNFLIDFIVIFCMNRKKH